MKKINEFDLGRGNPKNQRNFIPVSNTNRPTNIRKNHVFFNKQLEQFP